MPSLSLSANYSSSVIMSSAADLYHSVINDVISSIRESFLDESVDENVLMELKSLWTSKLAASQTIEPAAPAAATGRTQADALDARMASQGGGGGRQGRGGGQARGASASTSSASGSASASGAGGASGGGATVASSASGGQQLVITDPNRLVPVQITIPAQPGNPASHPRALTVQVPAHALQQSGSTSQILQSVLTTAITQALALPESHAAVFLQTQINNTFKLS